MLSFYTTAGVDRPFFSVGALASTVASKLGTAMVSMVSSFWGAGKPAEPKHKAKRAGSREEEQSVAAEPSTELPLQGMLDDSRRRVSSVLLDPWGELGVTTDDFGRVIVFEATSFTILRLWKGYREVCLGREGGGESVCARFHSRAMRFSPSRKKWSLSRPLPLGGGALGDQLRGTRGRGGRDKRHPSR